MTTKHTKHTPARALEAGGRALRRFRIAPWLNAQFPLPEDSDVVALREKMRRQGAGFAASRVLERLKRRGLAQWVVLNDDVWGWVLTGKRS